MHIETRKRCNYMKCIRHIGFRYDNGKALSAIYDIAFQKKHNITIPNNEKTDGKFFDEIPKFINDIKNEIKKSNIPCVIIDYDMYSFAKRNTNIDLPKCVKNVDNNIKILLLQSNEAKIENENVDLFVKKRELFAKKDNRVKQSIYELI